MTTIARPYAVAAFEFALAQTALPEWESMLSAATLVTNNSAVQNLLTDPQMTVKQFEELFFDVLHKVLDKDMKNFLRLLAENHRLAVLPEILELFINYRAEHDKTLDVSVSSAIALDKKYQEKLSHALTLRLKRKVILDCTVDASLLGGLIVTAGDMVFDGSIRGKLNRLNEFISGTL